MPFGTRCLAILAAFASGPSPACSRPDPAVAPDIVVILADDLGWADVGFHGAIDLATPSLDALASEGRRLERYYTAPLCSPARAGLLTGRSPLRLGLRRNVVSSDDGGLALDEELLPAAFARAGYETALVGKWHLGHARAEQRPNARGFERFYGFLGGWIDYATHARGDSPDWWRDERPIREPGHATELLAREAAALLLEPDRTRPLFLCVAFNAPHPPLGAAPRAGAGRTAAERARAAYVRAVEELDRAVGELRRAIDRGSRPTIVFFASDNGAALRFGGSNAPLRGEKHQVFEGAIRAPAFVWWPGRVAPGVADCVVTHQDVLPTLAGLASVALAPPRPLDGRDRWPALAGRAPAEREPAAFGVERGERASFALVGERWKLVESAGGGEPAEASLYDVVVDPTESVDRGGDEPEALEALRAELARWKSFPSTLPPLRRAAEEDVEPDAAR